MNTTKEYAVCKPWKQKFSKSCRKPMDMSWTLFCVSVEISILFQSMYQLFIFLKDLRVAYIKSPVWKFECVVKKLLGIIMLRFLSLIYVSLKLNENSETIKLLIDKIESYFQNRRSVATLIFGPFWKKLRHLL